MNRPKYINNLTFEKDITLDNGSVIHCYSIDNNFVEVILNDWALHIRRNYVSDDALELICGFGVDRYKYLLDRIPNVINSSLEKFKYRTITGEFAEILVMDFREFVQKEEVFRGRWEAKSTPTAPIQGCDIVSFIIDSKTKDKDQLIITESKSQLSSTNYDVLLDAAKDSEKDSTRIGMTLAFLAELYANEKDVEQCKKVARFIRKAEEPYIEKFEGSGLTIDSALSEENAKNALNNYFGSPKNLYFIYGNGLKDLAYDLYERALKC